MHFIINSRICYHLLHKFKGKAICKNININSLFVMSLFAFKTPFFDVLLYHSILTLAIVTKRPQRSFLLFVAIYRCLQVVLFFIQIMPFVYNAQIVNGLIICDIICYFLVNYYVFIALIHSIQICIVCIKQFTICYIVFLNIRIG